MSEQLELNLNDPRSRMTKEEYMKMVKTTFDEIYQLIERKNNDYTGGGTNNDPFANFRQAEDFGVDPLVGLAVRMGDKFNRIQTFCTDGKVQVVGEGVEDAFRDMIGYSMIALGLLWERRSQGSNPVPDKTEPVPEDKGPDPLIDKFTHLKALLQGLASAQAIRQLDPDEFVCPGDEGPDCTVISPGVVGSEVGNREVYRRRIFEECYSFRENGDGTFTATMALPDKRIFKATADCPVLANQQCHALLLEDRLRWIKERKAKGFK